jgi:hypothetical protein
VETAGPDVEFGMHAANPQTGGKILVVEGLRGADLDEDRRRTSGH